MRLAIEAPLDVMRACHEAAAHGHVVAQLGNPNASSDVQVGFELLRAGLRGARLNVDINLASIKDAAYADGVRDEVGRLVRAFSERPDA
jgi:formiminotetrahydrofolate cyclodeaminase